MEDKDFVCFKMSTKKATDAEARAREEELRSKNFEVFLFILVSALINFYLFLINFYIVRERSQRIQT